MKDFDKRFVRSLSEGDGIPESFDRAVEARLASLPERDVRRSAAWGPRALRIAVAAVLAVAVLGGTALAASTSLRELLWGGFEPYVQELESTPENTHVYDGVEARIVSALSDGYANILLIEVRDLEGDRVRDAWERFQETGENEFADQVNFTSVLDLDEVREEYLGGAPGAFSAGGWSAGLAARPVAFDSETGVLTLRASLFSAAPARLERQAVVEIFTGLAGTRARTVRQDSSASWTRTVTGDDGTVSVESGKGCVWYDPVVGWTLTAPLTGLAARDIALDGTEVAAAAVHGDGDTDGMMVLTSVHISQMGITVFREADGPDVHLEAPDELTVSLRDGSREVISGLWENHFYTDFDLNGDAVNADTWLFSAPVDPDSVVGIDIGGQYVALS